MKWQIKGGLIFGVSALAVIFYLLDPGEYELFPPCLIKSATGFYCPGCGSQRATHSLLHLNVAGVVSNNFLFLPAILAIGYHYIHAHLNRMFHINLPNVFYLKNTPLIIFIIVLLFWILRNLPNYPFTELAPK